LNYFDGLKDKINFYKLKYNDQTEKYVFAFRHSIIDYANNQLIITGWAFSKETQEVVDFSLKEKDQNRTLNVKRKYDFNINKEYDIDPTESLGFVLEISGIEPLHSILAFTDTTTEETELPIPELETEPLRYLLEIVEKQEDQTTVVRGWACNILTAKPVDFYLLNQSTNGVKIKRIIRNDVNNFFSFPLGKAYGFEIQFNESWENYPKNITLRFKSDDLSDECHFKINKNANYTEKKGLMLVDDAFAGYKYLQRHGLKDTLTRMKVEWLDRFGEKYDYWIEKNEPKDFTKIKAGFYDYEPLISIVVPVYNVEGSLLTECIESVRSQTYQNWQLCLVDDHSPAPHIVPLLEKYSAFDDRIDCVYRKENGHISNASNDGIAIAKGTFISLLDHDDCLAPFALQRVVEVLNKKPETDFIYSDEDKMTIKGKRKNPFFKPDWSPNTLLSQNYLCHFTTIRKTIVDQVGGFEVGLEGSQDYDLFLKCTEVTDKIEHISEILYHWRLIKASTAENPESKLYAFEAGKKALENALSRRNIEATVKQGKVLGTYLVTYAIQNHPKVSILIPTKDLSSDLNTCLGSIVDKTLYDNYEIIIIDNGSEKQATFAVFDYYKQQLGDRFKVLTLNIPFNYSRLNNQAAEAATGDYLVLLNNDVEIITKGWMIKMLGQAQQPRIGAVGAKLYYADDTVQHAGVVLGLGGVAGHAFSTFERKDPGYFAKMNIISDCGAVTAAMLMVKKTQFFEVGGLNEKDLTIAFNDVDFCIKLLEKNYLNVCMPNVEAYHYESKSRGSENTIEKQKRFEGEVDYMKRHWGKYLIKDPFYNKNLTLENGRYEINIR